MYQRLLVTRILHLCTLLICKTVAPNSIMNRKPGGMQLQMLPVELIHIIFDLLATVIIPEGSLHLRVKLIVDSGTLAALCQASRLLHQIGLPYLYRAIETDPDTMFLLAKTLCYRPDLGEMVRRLHIDTTWTGTVRETESLELLSPFLEHAGQENRSPYGVRDTINLIQPLLMATSKIEALCITTQLPSHVYLPFKVLDSLKELQFECPGLAVEDRLQRLLEEAPNLTTLIASGGYTDGEHRYSRITNLVLSSKMCQEDEDMFDFLNACHNLKHFTFYLEPLCLRDDMIRTMMENLRQHRSTLKTLHLEPIYCECSKFQNECIFSLRKFVRLEHLSISTRYFVWKNGGIHATDLLDKLPRSIRTLNILKEHNAVDSQILGLAEAQRQGRYPNLKELTLRAPRSLLEAEGHIPGLERTCIESGLKLSIKSVPDLGGTMFCLCNDEEEDFDPAYDTDDTE